MPWKKNARKVCDLKKNPPKIGGYPMN